jgi:hypothetical protein
MSDYVLTGFTTNVLTIPNITTADDLFFTVKADLSLDDTHSILKISQAAGLLILYGQTIPINGTNIITSSDGSIAISGSNLVVTLSALASSALPNVIGLFGDIRSKTIIGNIISVQKSFTLDINYPVGHSI